MAVPAIYLDECVDHRLARDLWAAGIDVVSVAEATAVGNDDEAQLIYATNERRVLLSQNQIDFRRLHARFLAAARPHGGIILVPQTVLYQRLRERVHLQIDWVATFSEHRSRLFTWTELQQQIIHGFRLPLWQEEAMRDAVGWRVE